MSASGPPSAATLDASSQPVTMHARACVGCLKATTCHSEQRILDLSDDDMRSLARELIDKMHAAELVLEDLAIITIDVAAERDLCRFCGNFLAAEHMIFERLILHINAEEAQRRSEHGETPMDTDKSTEVSSCLPFII
jgi:hypothetical protein